MRLNAPKRLSLRRMLLAFLGISSVILLLALFAVAILAVRISTGPLEVDMLREKVEESLRNASPATTNVSVGKTFLVRGEHGPTIRLDQLVVKDSQNRTLVAAPSADLAFSTSSLLKGKPNISGIDIAGLDLHMAVLEQGKIAVSAGAGESIELTPPPGASDLAANDIFTTLFASAAADAPIFGDIQRISLKNAHLQLEDRRNARQSTYSNVNFTVDRSTTGSLNLNLTATGKSGPFAATVAAKTDTAPNGGRHGFDFSTTDVPISEIADHFGLKNPPADASMPVSTKGSFDLDSNGHLATAEGKVVLGAGHILIDDPDAETILLDEVTTAFKFDAAKNRVDIPSLEIFSGLTHLIFSGQMTLADQPTGSHQISLTAKDGTFAGLPGDKPIALDSAILEANVLPAEQRLAITKLAVKGPDIDATASLNVQNTPAGPAVSGSVTGLKTKYRPLLRFWPSVAAAEVRKWLLQHLASGMLEKATLHFELDGPTFAAARAKQPIPETSLAIDLNVSNGALNLMPGLPLISNIDGTGHFSGISGNFNAAHALIDLGARKVNFSDAVLNIPDFRPKLFSATLSGRTQASLDAAVDLLSRDALRRYSNVPGEPAQYKGQLEGQVDIDFKIGKAATPDDVGVKTNLTASNVSVDKVFGGEKLDGATLAIVTTKTSLSVKGDGRMFAAPVNVELKKNGNAPTDASLNFILDDAGRAKRGIETGPGFTGPVIVKLSTQLADGDHSKTDTAKGETRANVELDLTRANIDGFLPGWLKPAGKPGKATFVATKDAESIELDQFQLDAGNASMRGSISLGSDGKFDSAKFSSFRLSTQDELKLDVQKDGNLYKLSGSAGTIDARPYISDLLAHSRAKAANGQDFDLDLKANALLGFNKERVEAIDVKLRRRSGVMQKVQLNSRLSGGALKIVAKDSDTVAGYVVTAENAGALLSFLDIYRRMEGGQLVLNVHPQAERISGAVQIQNFYLNDEPAMRSLINSNDPNTGDSPAHVKFKRLQGAFERTDGRIDITDAVMSGQQVGATLGGMVDYGHDRVDLSGNLIPAYEINNFFAKIPVVGPILGGGKNEGLFAINFRITGKASAPILRVDPLSAVAPGIFRKILGVADGTANNPDNFVVDVPANTPPTQSNAPLQLGKPKN